jgi:thiamine-monophosphate kinase
MTDRVLEIDMIARLTGHFARSPLQANRLQQSDSEIIRVPDGSPIDLAITMDSIAEEIQGGLYTDPYMIGWMAVMVNMSDLAAVGAEPFGIVISEILDNRCTPEFIETMQRGIQDACTACNSYVLGGDTNSGQQLILSGCALGRVRRGAALMRTGCQAGDVLYATGPLGTGNAYALGLLEPHLRSRITYLPQPRLQQGIALREFATACMDTSDGVLGTVDELVRLNRLGFSFTPDWERALDAAAHEVASRANIPAWLLLGGIHGEFELLFTIPPEREPDMLQAARSRGWEMLMLGTLTAAPEVLLPIEGSPHPVDTAVVRNLGHTLSHDPRGYLRALLDLHDKIVTS